MPPKRRQILATNERETDRVGRGSKSALRAAAAEARREERKEGRKEGRKMAHAPLSILRAIRI